jgi:dihydropteroate synthase
MGSRLSAVKDTFFCPKIRLGIGRRNREFDRPLVMGILNVTPDSFYASSRVSDTKNACEKTGQMISEGADIIDIGGYSSRPGADDISVKEELDRIFPVVTEIRNSYPDVLISIDTFRSEIAAVALKNGADIVNDISGGQADDKMFGVVAQFKAAYVLMHMRGNPQTMTNFTEYSDLVGDIKDFFNTQLSIAKKAGIENILIDPGFGFSKTTDQNFQLLRDLQSFQEYKLPILVGISRKSMVYKTLGIDVSEALHATSALHLIALKKGASILRVHDVREARQMIELAAKL